MSIKPDFQRWNDRDPGNTGGHYLQRSRRRSPNSPRDQKRELYPPVTLSCCRPLRKSSNCSRRSLCRTGPSDRRHEERPPSTGTYAAADGTRRSRTSTGAVPAARFTAHLSPQPPDGRVVSCLKAITLDPEEIQDAGGLERILLRERVTRIWANRWTTTSSRNS